MVDNVVGVLGLFRQLVAEIEVAKLDPEEGARLVEVSVEIEHLAAAARVLGTQAVERGDLWKREGFRSAAAWMANKGGLRVGPSIASLEMAGLFGQLPVLAAAFRDGWLSEAQAREIADAAAECPEAEERLVEAAQKLSLVELAEECRRVKASVITDDDDRYRKIRKGRYLRSWTDREGAVRLSARLTADEGARVLGAVDARCDDMIAEAFVGGWYEGRDAHRADALVDLARTANTADGRTGPEAMIHVWVDYDALVRGHTVEGERCEIPGIGPIPVSVAQRLSHDSILKIIISKGVDITAVAHGGRNIPAHLRTALECRDPKCIVGRCQVRRGLQIDHTGPYADTFDTSYENSARLCAWHHYQKCHLGYTYRGGPGNWKWIPPEVPTDPPIYPP